jgi:tRNA nucleotidyltransferase (CCA-adding enzyme)
MDVIVSHINADFDALASMLAAQKLYPQAKLVFPGAQEKSLRDFFVRSTFYVIEADRMKDIEMDEITTLILVDTRQRSRIGKFADIVDKPEVDVHVYDHHPPSSDDVTGTINVVESVGATVTILLRILREKGIPISPDEATVMMLGIYEDTGSLTFSSTTEEDFLAAAYLRSQGASLNIISDMVTRELNAEQVFMLHDLIRAQERYRIRGVDIVVTTASSNRYIGDVAVLVHKLKDMENLNVVFALIRMEDRIYLIGRSRMNEVNAAELAVEFGGGGHATAASATIKDLTLVQVKEKLLRMLDAVVKPPKTAKDIMIHPLKFVEEKHSLTEVHETLSRYHAIHSLPVLADGGVVGLISRPIVEMAVSHGLGDLPVREYMSTDVAMVGPDAPLTEVQGHIVGGRQRFVPVVDDGRLIGGITRSDVLRSLQDQFPPTPRGKVSARKKGVGRLLQERLPADVVTLLRELGEVGEDLGYHVYAVGGFVRDLLLRRENLDIDIVVEGDGIHFARTFGARHDCRVKVHKRMKTANVVVPTGYKVDIATARMEYYERPAAPPTVEFTSVKVDLYRRDFTINTLAIELRPGSFGNLLDFFEAQRDLKEGVIRVLHNLSFVEDPSRMFRAIRFEQRFGFHIGKHTESLMKNAVSMGFLEQLSGARLFTELELILREENPLSYLERIAEFDLMRFFHARLKYTTQVRVLLNRIYEVISWFDLLFLKGGYEKWMLYLYGLTDQLRENELTELIERLSLPPRNRRRMLEGRREGMRVLQRARRHRMNPKAIYTLFKPVDTEVLLYIMAKTDNTEVKKAISLFFTKLKNITVNVRGKDLQALGIKTGPLYRDILQTLLLAHLDGKVNTKEEELRYIRTHFLGEEI